MKNHRLALYSHRISLFSFRKFRHLQSLAYTLKRTGRVVILEMFWNRCNSQFSQLKQAIERKLVTSARWQHMYSRDSTKRALFNYNHVHKWTTHAQKPLQDARSSLFYVPCANKIFHNYAKPRTIVSGAMKVKTCNRCFLNSVTP